MSVPFIIKSLVSDVAWGVCVAFAPGRNRAITLAATSVIAACGLAVGNNRRKRTQARQVQIIDVREETLAEPLPVQPLPVKKKLCESDGCDSDDDEWFDAVEEFFPLYDLRLAKFRREQEGEYDERLQALHRLLDSEVVAPLLMKENGAAAKKVLEKFHKIWELFVDTYTLDGAWSYKKTKVANRKEALSAALKAFSPLIRGRSARLEGLLAQRLNFGRLCQTYFLYKDETLDDHPLMISWKADDNYWKDRNYPPDTSGGWKATLRSNLGPVVSSKWASFTAIKKFGLWGWSASKKVDGDEAFNGAIDYISAIGGVVLDLMYDQSDHEMFEELWKNIPDFCAGKPIKAKVRIEAVEWARTHPKKAPPVHWANALERVLEACFKGEIHGFGKAFRKEELTNEDRLLAQYDLLDLLYKELKGELAD